MRLIITGPIKFCYSNDSEPQVEVSVVRKVDNAVYWMNLSNDNAIGFPRIFMHCRIMIYQERYLSFEKPGPVR